MAILADMSSMTEKQFEGICTFVKEVCGINLHQGKKELVKARLAKRLRKLGLSKFEDYLAYMEKDTSGVELSCMLDALSTNLTSFFRESEHLDWLVRELTSGSETKRGGRRLRIWSAGCSSGEEPYSIGIILKEEVPGFSQWDTKVLATDLSTAMLALGTKGIYTKERIKDVPAKWRATNFTCIETRPEKLFQVNDDVRRMVTFGKLNLMAAWPMRGPFDFIFCRNVMIYFNKDTQGRLIERFRELLAPEGILFLGHSESLAGVKHLFNYVAPTVYRK